MKYGKLTLGEIEAIINKIGGIDVAKKILSGELSFSVSEPVRDSDTIVRTVSVNRNCTPQEALDAIGYAQYTDPKVVDAMPRGEGDKVEIVFFEVGRHISDDDLEKEYDRRGLKPVDPVSLIAFNEADPAFVDGKPHGTHWKDSNGDWCYAFFSRRRGRCMVHVGRRDDSGWGGGWWPAGVRK